MTEKIVSITVLRFLIKYPNSNYTEIKKYLGSRFTHSQIFRALTILQKHGYIEHHGEWTRYRYNITALGLNYVDRIDRIELIANVNAELSKYLLLNGEYNL